MKGLIRADLVLRSRPDPAGVRAARAVRTWHHRQGRHDRRRRRLRFAVEYAHAVAPQARIVVVEALPEVSDMISAEQYAVRHYHAQVISQSLTAAEQIDPSAADIARMHAAYAGLADDGV